MTTPSYYASPYDAVTWQFHRTADLLGMDDAVRAVLAGTYRELRAQIPLTLDDGTTDVVYGYRVE